MLEYGLSMFSRSGASRGAGRERLVGRAWRGEIPPVIAGGTRITPADLSTERLPMMLPRRRLERHEVEFQVSFAVGRVGRSIWRDLRGKNEAKSESAEAAIVRAVMAQLDRYEVWRDETPTLDDVLPPGGPSTGALNQG